MFGPTTGDRVRGKLWLAKETVAVTGPRTTGNAGMGLNDAMLLIEAHPETCEVRTNGELLTCEPADVLPLAERHFLYCGRPIVATDEPVVEVRQSGPEAGACGRRPFVMAGIAKGGWCRRRSSTI